MRRPCFFLLLLFPLCCGFWHPSGRLAAQSGNVLFAEGEAEYGKRAYRQALPFFERAAAAFEKADHADSLVLALVWQGWSLIYQERYPEAYERIGRARSLSSKADQELSIERRYDLEQVFQKYYSRTSDPVRSGMSLLAMARLQTASGPPYDQKAIGSIWNKYGANLVAQQQPEAALAAFDTAALWFGDPRSSGYLSALNNRAILLRQEGRFEEALDAQRGILSMRRALAHDPASDRHVAVSHHNLANTLLSMGLHKQALVHAEAFLKRYPTSSSSWRLNAVRGHTLQGRIHLAMDQHDAANAAFDQALLLMLRENWRTVAEPLKLDVDAPHPLDRFRTAQELLEVLDGKASSLYPSQADQAWMWSCSAMDLIDSIRIAYPEGLTRGFYQENVDAVYRNYMRHFAGRHNADWDARAWQAMERNKYLRLFHARQERAARFEAALPGESITRLRNIEGRMARLYRDLRRAQYGEAENTLRALQADRRRMQSLYDRVVDSLVGAHPSYGQSREGSPEVGMDAVQTLLAHDEVYLAFYDAGDALYRLALTRDSAAWTELEWSMEMQQGVPKLLKALREPAWFGANWVEARQRILQDGAGLYHVLLGDWLGRHPEIHRLTLLPDGALTDLPFGALPLSPEADDGSASKVANGMASPAAIGFKNTDWLGTRYAIRYAHSGNLLMMLQRDPDAPDAIHRSALAPSATGMLGLAPDYSSDPSWPALPGAAAEVAMLQSAFGAEALTGNAASTLRLDSALAGRPYRVLHLAAHSVVDSTEPLDSYVQLADGPLPIWAISGLDLDAQLVVLSSCSSLGGRHVRGEGLYSLARAFFQAGSSGMLGALWLSDDRSASELMASFYGSLAAQKQPAMALRDARVAYLTNNEERYCHPFYWAGYAYMGSNAAMDGLQRHWWQDPLSHPWAWLLCLGALLMVGLGLLFWTRSRRNAFAGGA